MSIYVELLEKDNFFKKENKAGFKNNLVKKDPVEQSVNNLPDRVGQDASFFVNTNKEAADTPTGRETPKANNLVDTEQPLEDELPAIRSSWDSILSGTTKQSTETEKGNLKASSSLASGENNHAVEDEFSELQDVREFTAAEKNSVKSLDREASIYSGARRSPELLAKGRVTERLHHEKSIVPIPIRKLRLRGMVTPDMEHKGIVEEFRHLKRILAKNIAKSDRNMGVGIVITSALPGEGKTFTALNLILSLSMEKSKNILLVDADLEKGGSTRFMELERHSGLRDYLEDTNLELEDVMVQTDMPNLRIIPRGIAETHSAEVFSSKRMESLIEKLCNSDVFDMVIFDAPPALVSSSANIISGLVDQTLVVVQANETSGNNIRELEENLIDSRSMGYVLNRAPYSGKKHNIYYAQND